jgi:hypothetical protein
LPITRKTRSSLTRFAQLTIQSVSSWVRVAYRVMGAVFLAEFQLFYRWRLPPPDAPRLRHERLLAGTIVVRERR